MLTLFVRNEPIHLINVYSDDQHRGIDLIAERAHLLPQVHYMGRDFNCHSSEWDPRVDHHRAKAVLLLETAARLGVEYAPPQNPGMTFVSRIDPNIKSVIDLVFVPPAEVIAWAPKRDIPLSGESDHIHLVSVMRLDQSVERLVGYTLKSEEDDTGFWSDIIRDLPVLNDSFDLGGSEGIDLLSAAIEATFSRAWDVHSEEFIITPHSKKWWNDACKQAYEDYQEVGTPEARREFRSTVKKAKHEFFDERIKDTSEKNARPWDLMSWVKERKNLLARQSVTMDSLATNFRSCGMRFTARTMLQMTDRSTWKYWTTLTIATSGNGQCFHR
jgi:hypothetical protein